MRFSTYLSALVIGMSAMTVSVNAAHAQTNGGTFRGILEVEPGSLDPFYWKQIGDRSYYHLFYDTLVRTTEKGELIPGLAKSWEMKDGGKSIILNLRQDVVFHDGTPFNAEAVKFNIDRLLDPAKNATARSFVEEVKSAEVIDAHTIKLSLTHPSGLVLSMFAYDAGMMASPTAFKRLGDSYARNPVGTGPFVFRSWQNGEVVATRFDKYWEKDKEGRQLPYLDRVQFRVISEATSRILELRARNAEMIERIPIRDAKAIDETPGLKVLDSRQWILQNLIMNFTKAPTNNADLRLAIAQAINYSAVEKLVSSGMGIAATGLLAPSDWAYDPNQKGNTYNVAAAREAYKRSGHTGPVTISIIKRDLDMAVGQLVQAMLVAAGINAKVEVLERTAWIDKTVARNHEGALVRLLSRTDPDHVFKYYFGENPFGNYSGFRSPETDDLVNRARESSDLAVRKQLYQKLNAINTAGNYYIPLAWVPTLDATDAKVQGFERESGGPWILRAAWLGK